MYVINTHNLSALCSFHIVLHLHVLHVFRVHFYFVFFEGRQIGHLPTDMKKLVRT